MGMHYFMRLIGDEAQAAKPILRIPSLYQAGSTVEVPVQDHPTVFVLPGVEGKCMNFREFGITSSRTFLTGFYFNPVLVGGGEGTGQFIRFRLAALPSDLLSFFFSEVERVSRLITIFISPLHRFTQIYTHLISGFRLSFTYLSPFR